MLGCKYMKKILTLNTGSPIPILGFGTWELTGEECLKSTKKSIEVGYRHIDTAAAYKNHKEVGQAIKKSGVNREDLFITSKLWRDNLKKEAVSNALKLTLEELQLDYLDLYLIHWPNLDVPVEETLKAMNELKEQGLVKAIGVSNFTIHRLQESLNTGIQFSVNQVEFHPTLNQKELLIFCKQNNIILTAYSPIGRGEDLKHPVIKELAGKYEKSAAQVILNWEMQKGIVTIPKSSNLEHIKDNFQSLEWDLSQEDVERIDHIDEKNRMVNPDFAEFSD